MITNIMHDGEFTNNLYTSIRFSTTAQMCLLILTSIMK